MATSKNVYAVVAGSEDQDIKDIDLYSELIDGGLLFFETTQAILDYHNDEEDIENCKVFLLTFSEVGEIANNPKIVKIDLSTSKRSKK